MLWKDETRHDSVRTLHHFQRPLPVAQVRADQHPLLICTTILNHAGPGWLNALVILFTWNGFKMLRIDPVTLVLRRYIRVTQPDRSANADTCGEEAQDQYEVETMGAAR